MLTQGGNYRLPHDTICYMAPVLTISWYSDSAIIDILQDESLYKWQNKMPVKGLGTGFLFGVSMTESDKKLRWNP